MNPSTASANIYPMTRVFVLLVTDSDALPDKKEYTGKWVVAQPSISNDGGQAQMALLDCASPFIVPSNAIICPDPNQGLMLLQKVKAEVFPEMSEASGLQSCVVHTEGVMDMNTGQLSSRLMLFPVGFLAMKDFVRTQTDMEQKVMVEKPTESEAEADGKKPEIVGVAPVVEEHPTVAQEAPAVEQPTPDPKADA